MKPIIVILSVLVVTVSMLVGYDADGGWLFHWRQRTPSVRKPTEVPFPIDEVPTGGLITCPTDGSASCPLPLIDLSVRTAAPSDMCIDLAARVASLERRLDDIANTQPQSQSIDYSTLAAHLPPVRMEIHHPDGTVYTQSKPLGEPIRLRLVPQ